MASSHPLSSDRPRTRGLSFSSKKSDKSWRSKDAKPKVDDLIETANEKSKRRITSKADPTKAMTEEEPSVAAANTSLQVNHESIRLMQHRDIYGNVIADPDRSNPTRSRWERPLDTVRAFEAAIDGPSRRSYPPQRNDSSDALSSYNGRRNSSLPRHGANTSNARYSSENTYQGGSGTRPDSYASSSIPPNSYFNQSRNKYTQRMSSDPNSNNGVYPSHGYQQSYDTVTTQASGNGSHFTDQYGNSTNPSSENSSLDRNPHILKPVYNDANGYSNHGNAQQQQFGNGQYEQNGGQYPQAPQQQQYGFGGPRPYHNGNSLPTPPKGDAPIRRAPIKLGAGDSVQPIQNTQAPPADKRKSWFKRFSKSN